MGILDEGLPSEFASVALDVPDELRPLKLLCAATLTRAIRDSLGVTYPHFAIAATRGGGVRAAIISDAKRWIGSENWEPFSFLWICEVLELSPAGTRKHILEISNLPEVDLLMNRKLGDYKAAGGLTSGRSRIEHLISALFSKRSE